MIARDRARRERLLPKGVPRYVRCYDAGDAVADRYTVVFSGNWRGKPRSTTCFRGMSAHPTHPLGFGQWGEHRGELDSKGGWTLPVGRRHPTLGLRIPFADLPPDCRELAMRDYCELWGLGKKEKHGE